MDTRTHYVPAMTRRNEQGQEQAICGTYVSAAQIAPADRTPQCWGCALWLHEVEHPHQQPAERARVLATITEAAPWGEERTA